MRSDTGSMPSRVGGLFERAADFMSHAIGAPAAFMVAFAVVLVWAAAGPAADFSNTWQLIINSFTTITTFLMVFLLGNASNRMTENQDRMLAGIYGEEHRLHVEEQLIRKLLEKIDVQHIRPILKHLEAQDHQLEVMAERLLSALREPR